MFVTFPGRTQKLYLFPEVESREIESRQNPEILFSLKNPLLRAENDGMYTI